jgi:2-iminobutanoate/2-iminopropanoate deaminase
MPIEHVNPPTLFKSPAFSQAVVAKGAGKLIIVGGQNAVDKDGKVVGDDLYTQSRQALDNVIKALEAAGASQKDVVRLAIYTRSGLKVEDGFKAAQEVWGPHPTAITVVEASSANPKYLVEIEAMAFLSE